MEEQPSALLQLVLFKVNAADCARAACVARLWREIGHQEILWKSHCHADYAVTALEAPLGNPCGSWKVRPELLWGCGVFLRSAAGGVKGICSVVLCPLDLQRTHVGCVSIPRLWCCNSGLGAGTFSPCSLKLRENCRWEKYRILLVFKTQGVIQPLLTCHHLL